MNKILTKIAGAVLGLSMAVGVGTAVAVNAKEPVRADAATQTYELITSAPSDWSGEYILANGTSGTVKMLDGSSFSSSSFSGIDVTVSDNKITADSADAITIAKSSTSGKYTVKVNGKFVGRNANSNGVDASDTWSSNVDNAISYSSSKVTIAGNGGRVLTWFANNSNFRYYASSNNNSQLYKKVESGNTPTINLSDTELSVGLNGSAEFTVNTAHLTSNFSITGGDDTYFTTSYTSSSEDGDHKVTIQGKKITSSPITLTVSSTNAESKTIDISVVENIVYTKATTTSEIKVGRKFIIGNADGTSVLGKYVSGNNCPSLTNVPTGGNLETISLPDGYALFTVTGTSEAWTLTDQDGNVYYATSGENRLQASSSSTDTWTISITNGTATLESHNGGSGRTLQYNSGSSIYACYTSSQKPISIYVEPSTDPAIQVDVTSGSTTMDVNDETTLTATKLNGATGTVGWVTEDSSIVSISSATGDQIVVTAEGKGTATVTASLSGCDDVEIEFTVKAGSADAPYSVAEAIAAIDAGEGLTDVYTSGIVCQVDSYSSQYKSITYWISDDGTTTTMLEVYSGKGLNNTDFSDVNDVQIGAEVTVYGTLKKYGSTYEYDKNNYLTSYTPPSVSLASIVRIDNTLSANSGAEEWDLSGLVPMGTLSNSSDVVNISAYVKLTTSDVPGTVSVDTAVTVDVVVTPRDSSSSVPAKTIGVSGVVHAISGPLTDGGRYYIMNSDKTRGLSAIESTSTPDAIDLTASNNLIAFDVKLVANNSYEITTTVGSIKYYLVANTTATSGSSANQAIRVISNPTSGLATHYWVLDNTDVETTGAYHAHMNTTSTYNRYLSYYTDSSTKWDWRCYLNTTSGDPEIQFVEEKSFALNVAEKILESCEERGSSTYDTTAWGNAKSAYNAITISGEKTFLIEGDAVKDSSDTIECALEQYDYAVVRYNLSGTADAFITGRTGIYPAVNGVNNLLTNLGSEATVSIIVVISVISLTTIGAFVFVRRRKEN